MNKKGGDVVTSHQNQTPDRLSAFSRSQTPVITLLTDFGTSDSFVAAMKGVILSGNPNAQIVDITHEIPPQDIEAGAFVLLTAWSTFPPSTIHVAVVDPGVGSSRKPILISAGGQFFIGPDNGLFSYVCEQVSVKEIVHVDDAKFFRERVSNTFNGRDIFAPVAAALSTGVKPKEFGPPISDYVRLEGLKPELSGDGRVRGRILHVDRFGNCITNVTPKELNVEEIRNGAVVRIKGKTIRSFRNYFSETSKNRGELFAIWGSAGFLEIAATNQSAAKILKIRRGDAVNIDAVNRR